MRDAWELPRSGKNFSDNQANSTTRPGLKKCARSSASALTKHRPKHGALTVVGWLLALVGQASVLVASQHHWLSDFVSALPRMHGQMIFLQRQDT